MSTIFISHASADNALAVDLGARLRKQGHTCVFLDLDPEQGIVAGRSWERTLYRKLRACRVVVALCTDAYLQSQWCFAEIALARMEGKPIVALLTEPLAEGAKLPSIISETQFIDLRANPDDGYRRLWRGLEELDLLGSVGDWDPRASPYLGLSAYHEEHAPVFFGREAEVRAGVELLDRGAPGLIMVLGASGSGKSSLARAGIVPRLRREPGHWVIADPMRPGRDPFAELAQVLAEAFRRYGGAGEVRKVGAIRRRLEGWHAAPPPLAPAEPAPETDPGPETQRAADMRLRNLLVRLEGLRHEPPEDADPTLLDFLDWSLEDLRRICGQPPGEAPELPGSTPLADMAVQLRRLAGQSEAQVLLVIDQFEELLGQQGTQGARFLELLAATLAVEGAPVTVLATMRSDFLAAFQQANAALGMDFESLSLGPMPVEGMRQVIEAPAKLGAIELEPGLADRMLEDAKSADALPLLSFTLWLLWRECQDAGLMTLKAYGALGGLDGAVAGEADAILKRARQQGREEALRLAFLKLVRLTHDGQFARAPVPWDTAELRPVEDLLEAFIERRLLVSRAEGGGRVVEVAHESLFRTWAPLRDWIEQHRAEYQLRQQVRQAALDWQRDGRPADHLWRGSRLEQAIEMLAAGGFGGRSQEDRLSRGFVAASEAMRKRQSRRRRNIVIAVTTVLLGFLGYAIYEEHQAKTSERQSWARQQSLAALNQLDSDPLQSIAIARRAVCVTQVHDGAVLPEAQRALNRAVQAAQRQRTLEGHSLAVTEVNFLPGDGTVQRMVSLGRDGGVRLWSLPGTGAPRCSAVPGPETISDGVRRMALAPGGEVLTTADRTGTIDTRAVQAGGATVAPSIKTVDGTGATAMVISPDGSRLAVGRQDGSVLVRPLRDTGSAGVSLSVQRARVTALAFSEDGAVLAVGAEDGTVMLWDGDLASAPQRLEGHAEAITALAISDGRLASGGWDRKVRIWDIVDGGVLQELEHAAVVSDLIFVPHSDRSGAERPALLASASWDRTVRIWGPEAATARHVLPHGAPVETLALAPDRPEDGAEDGAGDGAGFRLASGDWDGRVSVWALDRTALATASPTVVAHHRQPVNDLSFSADGSRLASASDDARIKVTTLIDHGPDHDWKSGLDVTVQGPEGTKWIAVITGGGVRVQQTGADGDPLEVTGYSGSATGVAFDGEGRLAVRADRVYEVYLDPRDLMICADRMIGATASATDMAALCAGVDLPEGIASIWSQAAAAVRRLGQE